MATITYSAGAFRQGVRLGNEDHGLWLQIVSKGSNQHTLMVNGEEAYKTTKIGRAVEKGNTLAAEHMANEKKGETWNPPAGDETFSLTEGLPETPPAQTPTDATESTETPQPAVEEGEVVDSGIPAEIHALRAELAAMTGDKQTANAEAGKFLEKSGPAAHNRKMAEAAKKIGNPDPVLAAATGKGKRSKQLAAMTGVPMKGKSKLTMNLTGTAKKPKAAAKPVILKADAKDTGTHIDGTVVTKKRPGCLAHMNAMLAAASEKKPVTKVEILDSLCATFPERTRGKMNTTLSMWVPAGVKQYHKIVVAFKTVERDGEEVRGYWMDKAATAKLRGE